MFYEPGKSDHGLPYDPFKACVIPRPIGWISTISAEGIANLAPFSQFNNLTFDPPYVMFAANQTPHGKRKDSAHNAEQTGVFCWNLATWELRKHVNASAEFVPSDVDEFARTGLEKAWSKVVRVRRVGRRPDGANGVGGGAVAQSKEVEEDERGMKVPQVARSPVRFECSYYSTIRLPGNPPMGAVDVIIGRVVGIHIDESVITDGKLDATKTQPIARCGYYQYAVVRETFDMIIPGENNALLGGLEGSSRINQSIEVVDGNKDQRST